MFLPGTPIPIAALRYRGAGILIPPAQYPTVLTPVLGTFAATGLAATGEADNVNLLLNGGFETPGAGGADVFADWAETASDGVLVATTTAGEFRTGTAAKLTAGAANATRLEQTLVAIPGTTLSMVMWTRGDGTNAGRYGVINVTGGGYLTGLSSTSVTAAAYSQVVTPFSVAAGCVFMRPVLRCPLAAGGIAYFDDCSLYQQRAIAAFTLAPHGRVDIPITTPATSVVPFGIVGRMSWPSCWYLRVTPNTAGNDLEIVEVNAGVMTSRAATDLDFAASTEYTFGLQCMGNVIKGFVNNVEILNYTDPSWLWTDVPYWGIMDSAWPNGTFGTITGRA